ncbi:MAG: hypothetical protein L6R39_000007 [Caloplaca ligustica]|nr:MAG: hypothetical protein L6R39_000007 [Caloplaca ligustica]
MWQLSLWALAWETFEDDGESFEKWDGWVAAVPRKTHSWVFGSTPSTFAPQQLGIQAASSMHELRGQDVPVQSHRDICKPPFCRIGSARASTEAAHLRKEIVDLISLDRHQPALELDGDDLETPLR